MLDSELNFIIDRVPSNGDGLTNLTPLMAGYNASKGEFSSYVGAFEDLLYANMIDDILVAKDWDIPAGMVMGYPTGTESYFSDGLYVSEEYRGMGLGKLLKKNQMELARMEGHRVLGTYIHEENLPSIAIHQYFGFEFEGPDYEGGYRVVKDLSKVEDYMAS